MDKILVIDDSAVQAEYLRSILKEEYDVTVCNTAKEGLSAAKEGCFGLILLDIVMPDMDGFVLLQELKETDLTKHIPVIMLTSLSDVQYEERGLLMGAVDYVAKPFSPVIIRARVNSHIQLYHYQMEFKQQAMVDELTGVANRRRYEGESLAKWREAIRFGMPLSICMFDIDKFKLYNDTFGHPAGDQVISAVAKEVSAHFRRATDLFARYGGEGRPQCLRVSENHPPGGGGPAHPPLLPGEPVGNGQCRRRQPDPQGRRQLRHLPEAGRYHALRRQAPGPQPGGLVL